MSHKFNYIWTKKDANFTKDKGSVFSCFACGGGSTMGYKLAGFDVIGCNEIDPRMNKCYVKNHHPKFNYLCDIREMVKDVDLPVELYNLDVLDGSPPCSTFSMAGSREDAWGIEKKFREGQKKQVLDTLFFDFIDLANKLKPKVVVAENVKGLLLGSAIEYVRKIYDEFDKAGYYCQHFLLDASKMGVPQKRERVFFICLRKDLGKHFLYQHDLFEQKPKIDLQFNEKPILFGELKDLKGKKINKATLDLWKLRKKDDKCLSNIAIREQGKNKYFTYCLLHDDKVSPTLTAHIESLIQFDEPKFTSDSEVKKISTFPMDYDFCGCKPHYLCGMSVPPVMMAQIASRIYEQWLSKL